MTHFHACVWLDHREAKIFGVGGLLEKKLLGDLERSYEKSAAFTNAFVSEKGL